MIIEVNIFYTNTRTCGLFLFKGLWPEEEQQTLSILGPKGTSRTAFLQCFLGRVAPGPGVYRNLGRMCRGPGGQPASPSTGLPLGTREALRPSWLLGAFGALVLPAPASSSVKRPPPCVSQACEDQEGWSTMLCVALG